METAANAAVETKGMHKSAEMPYHIGLKVKLYLNYEQKRLVAVNDGAKRAVYNHLVASGMNGTG